MDTRPPGVSLEQIVLRVKCDTGEVCCHQHVGTQSASDRSRVSPILQVAHNGYPPPQGRRKSELAVMQNLLYCHDLGICSANSAPMPIKGTGDACLGILREPGHKVSASLRRGKPVPVDINPVR